MTSLAINGGTPVRRHAFSRWPIFGDDEIEAATTVLRSGRVNYWTGDECRKFESEYAQSLGVAHAISVANGTLALELALYALGIGPGDEIVVPSRTFVATASCVVARGARPVVADVDDRSGNLTADTVERVLTSRTKAVISVHMAGWPCDMDPIMALAARKGLQVVEDCAQAHGATYKGRPVGSFGHCAAFSFCQDKIITTGGEGGMLVTNDAGIWRRAWEYKDHGKNWDAVHEPKHPPGFRWLHDSFGSNFRMTEMQAAIGRRQLVKLPDWITKRRANAAALAAGLATIPALDVPVPTDDTHHAYYKFYALLRPERLKPEWNQGRIIAAITAEGVPCMAGSCCEIYRENAFVLSGLGPTEALPVAHRLSSTSLMFLVDPTLSLDDMEDAVVAARKVLTEATR